MNFVESENQLVPSLACNGPNRRHPGTIYRFTVCRPCLGQRPYSSQFDRNRIETSAEIANKLEAESRKKQQDQELKRVSLQRATPLAKYSIDIVFPSHFNLYIRENSWE